jgi:DNA repair protein RecO (recombination protein O)
MVCAYTLGHGRVALCFPGVNKYNSRLKALSEPFVKSSARIYIRNNAAVGCVTGGKLESVHPSVRKDIGKTNAALYFCELFYRLTPEHSPNEDKFLFLESSLNELETCSLNPGIAPAFLLRLMQLSGYGLKEMPVLSIGSSFWDKMHNAPFGSLSFLEKDDTINLNKARYVCRRFLNRYLQYPLHTAQELGPAQSAMEEAQMETALEPAPALAT